MVSSTRLALREPMAPQGCKLAGGSVPDGQHLTEGLPVAEVARAGMASEHLALGLRLVCPLPPWLCASHTCRPWANGWQRLAWVHLSHGGSAPPWGHSPASDAHGSSPSISPRPSPPWSYTLANRTPTRHPSHRPPCHESGHVLTCAALRLLQSRARAAHTAGSPLGGFPLGAILRSRP